MKCASYFELVHIIYLCKMKMKMKSQGIHLNQSAHLPHNPHYHATFYPKEIMKRAAYFILLVLGYGDKYVLICIIRFDFHNKSSSSLAMRLS
jgi:hypothetical protein